MTPAPLRDWQTPVPPAASRADAVAGRPVASARWRPAAVRRLAEAMAVAGEMLATLPPGRLESAWCETVAAYRDPTSAERRTLDPALAATCRLSPEGLAAGLEAVLGGVAGAAARHLFEIAASRRSGTDGERSPALIVLASNLPALAVQPLLPALALARPAILKSPRAEPLFAPAFAAALTAREPALGKVLAALTWSGGDRELEAPLLAAAGRVIAYGEQSTLDDLERRAPGKLVAYGPKTSLAVVDASCDPAAVAPDLARDVALFDQRGCLSIAAVYTDGDAEELARRLAAELAGLARRWPPHPPDPRTDAAALAAVQQIRAEAELNGWPLHALAPPAGTVVVDPRPTFRPTPGLRTVRIHPLADLAPLPTHLTPWTGKLQGAALAGPAAESLDLTPLGISRTAPPGQLQSPDTTWHNGGIHPLDALSDPG